MEKNLPLYQVTDKEAKPQISRKAASGRNRFFRHPQNALSPQWNREEFLFWFLADGSWEKSDSLSISSRKSSENGLRYASMSLVENGCLGSSVGAMWRLLDSQALATNNGWGKLSCIFTDLIILCPTPKPLNVRVHFVILPSTMVLGQYEAVGAQKERLKLITGLVRAWLLWYWGVWTRVIYQAQNLSLSSSILLMSRVKFIKSWVSSCSQIAHFIL